MNKLGASYFSKLIVTFVATTWTFAMTSPTRAAEIYRWPLNETLTSDLIVDRGQIRFRITNESSKPVSIQTLLSDAEYLKDSILKIQFSDPSAVGEAYPTFKLSGTGIPGMGSRFFLLKQGELAAGKSTEARLGLLEALKAINNPALAKQLAKPPPVFRLVASIDRQILDPPQKGFLQFVSPLARPLVTRHS